MRNVILSLALISTFVAHARPNGKKKLIVALGYGAAWSRFKSDSASNGSTGTSLDFAFDYGIARKWALGVHYQRIGAHHIFHADQNARATTYELMVSYALIMRDRSALDVMIGFGRGLTSFTVKGDRLSSDAQSGSLSLGMRYWRCLSTCVGVYASLWYTSVQSAPLTYADPAVAQQTGSSRTLEWHGPQLTVGAIVRF